MRVPLHSPLLLHLIIPPFPLSLKHLWPVSVKWCFFQCLRIRNGNHSTKCWKLVSLETRVSRASAQDEYLITGSPEIPLLATTNNGFFSGLRSQTWTVSSETGPHRLCWGFFFDQSWAPLSLEGFRQSCKMRYHGPASTDSYDVWSLCLIQSHIWPPFSGPAPLNGLQPA